MIEIDGVIIISDQLLNERDIEFLLYEFPDVEQLLQRPRDQRLP
ncbi:acyl-CoA dehydrogenase N-terminal domain-containing protein [Microbulbifer donghaiensis]|nr:acyl-CoA dehydrogenase N-terminal domain-containing protein [Microbulbifer donghaiensis]